MSDGLELLLGLWQRGLALAERHRRSADQATAAAIAVMSMIGLAVQGRLRHADTIVFCVLLCAPLLLRRSRGPGLAFAAVAAVCLVQWLTSTPQLADASVLLALYWVALDGQPAELGAAAVAVEVGAILAALRWSPVSPVKTWVGLTGLAVAAAVLGVTVRQRRALLASLHERAARLEFERDQEGRLAAAAERARIAREMHDIVSHNLTVMISLADGAAYVMDGAPERVQPALERVSATGRQALVEMRRLLGVLRDEPDEHPLEPQPGLERLDELVASVNAAGVPVSMEVVGEPRELGDGVQLAVFRVAQEALTNTLKHAGRPATAHLALHCRAERIDLEVIDTGAPRAATVASAPIDTVATAGRGLRGMSERAAAYGGALEAGPTAGGGWRVHLSLQPDPDSYGDGPR